jgi:hypothetical protein
MNFSQKVWTPFKIQTNSIWICFLDFYLKIYLEFELLPKRKYFPFEFIYHNVQFGIFWSFRSTIFLFCKLESAWLLEILLNICFGPGPVEQYRTVPGRAHPGLEPARGHSANDHSVVPNRLHHIVAAPPLCPWFPIDYCPWSRPRAPPPPRLILCESHRWGQVVIRFPLLTNHQRLLLLLTPLLYLSPHPSAPSVAAGSRWCLLMRLHVAVNWGSPRAKPATAQSRSDATRHSPLPRPRGPHHGQPSPAKERSHLLLPKLQGLTK